MITILSLCIPSMIWPDNGKMAVNAVMSWITYNFGWLYLVLGVVFFIILLWMAFGRFGNVKLGGPGDEPEFSKPTWIAMLFCAGIGSSLVYWSIIEPIYYMQSPPLGLEKGTNLAAEWAATYGAFHWGFSAWAFYCIPVIPIAYSYHVRKESRLTFSTASC